MESQIILSMHFGTMASPPSVVVRLYKTKIEFKVCHGFGVCIALCQVRVMYVVGI